MVFSELVLGFLTNLIYDFSKKVPKEISDTIPKLYGKAIKEFSNKNYKLNGIKIMAGAGTGQYNSFLFGIGWIHESFKKYRNNNSFTFELGPGYAYTDYFKYNMYHNESYSGGNIAIYWKVQWNCFKY